MLKRAVGNLVHYQLTHRITDKRLWDVLGGLPSFLCNNPITGNVEEYSKTILKQPHRSHQSFQLDTADAVTFERIISTEGWVISDGTTRPADIERCASTVQELYESYFNEYNRLLECLNSDDVVLVEEDIESLVITSGEIQSAITQYTSLYRGCSVPEKELREAERSYMDSISRELAAMYPRSLLPLQPRESLASVESALSVLRRLDPAFNCVSVTDKEIVITLPQELKIIIGESSYKVDDPSGALRALITSGISRPVATTSGPRLLRRQGALSTNGLLTDK